MKFHVLGWYFLLLVAVDSLYKTYTVTVMLLDPSFTLSIDWLISLFPPQEKEAYKVARPLPVEYLIIDVRAKASLSGLSTQFQ